ncbi:MAG: cobalt ECF transporter T component CbiQ [Rhodobacteraceae bacterium]|nr:cobalt ECF transporter T component CbiQ [Paracoccaceae bacterium]
MSVTTLDRAASLNRWRHRALAEKALIGLGFLALAVGLPPWPGAALSGLAVLGFTFAGARVPLRLWLAAVALPLGFLATGALMLMVQVGADGIALAPGGAERAALLCLRAMAATFCLMFLAFTTPAAELISGLRRLRVPAEIVELALLTYRFVFLIAEEAVAMTAAQRARLGHSSRRRWLRSTAMVIANLLPRALARARRLETGLAARGWQGEMRVLSAPVALSRPMIALVLTVQGATLLLGGLL